MSAELTLRANSGGSITLQADDTLTTDDVITITKAKYDAIPVAWGRFSTPIGGGSITMHESYNIIGGVVGSDDSKCVVTLKNEMLNTGYLIVGSNSAVTTSQDKVNFSQTTTTTFTSFSFDADNSPANGYDFSFTIYGRLA